MINIRWYSLYTQVAPGPVIRDVVCRVDQFSTRQSLHGARIHRRRRLLSDIQLILLATDKTAIDYNFLACRTAERVMDLMSLVQAVASTSADRAVVLLEHIRAIDTIDISYVRVRDICVCRKLHGQVPDWRRSLVRIHLWRVMGYILAKSKSIAHKEQYLLRGVDFRIHVECDVCRARRLEIGRESRYLIRRIHSSWWWSGWVLIVDSRQHGIRTRVVAKVADMA